MSIVDLWLPILAASGLVMVASVLLWSVLPHHKKDVTPGPERLEQALGALRLPPGVYVFPMPGAEPMPPMAPKAKAPDRPRDDLEPPATGEGSGSPAENDASTKDHGEADPTAPADTPADTPADEGSADASAGDGAAGSAAGTAPPPTGSSGSPGGPAAPAPAPPAPAPVPSAAPPAAADKPEAPIVSWPPPVTGITPPEPGKISFRDPQYLGRRSRGPWGTLTLWPGPGSYAARLIKTFAVFVVTSVFVAYVTAAALPAGADYLRVFQIAGSAAVLGHVFGGLPHDVFFGKPARFVITELFDRVVYALLTAGVFAAMWPEAAAEVVPVAGL